MKFLIFLLIFLIKSTINPFKKGSIFKFGLTNEQLEAVCFKNGRAIVFAGPGSGKTRVITYRIMNLLLNNIVQYPQKILAITFTNKATSEMQNRIYSIDKDYNNKVKIINFHSFCFEFLKYYGYLIDINKYIIFNDYLKEKVISKIRRDFRFWAYLKNRNLSLEIDKKKYGLKNEFYYSQDKDTFHDFFNTYENYLKNNSGLDYADLINKTIEIFIKYPKILNIYQDTFPYILVDEFQDTNLPQFKLISFLENKNHNVIVVADDDQAIYTFRGSQIEFLGEFIRNFSPKIFPLTINFRSTRNIIKTSNYLVQNVFNSIRKIIIPYKKAAEGKTPVCFITPNRDREIEIIGKYLKYLIKCKKYKESQIAILFRSRYTFIENLLNSLKNKNFEVEYISSKKLQNPEIEFLKKILRNIEFPTNYFFYEDFVLTQSELQREINRTSLVTILDGYFRGDLGINNYPNLNSYLTFVKKCQKNKNELNILINKIITKFNINLNNDEVLRNYIEIIKNQIKKGKINKISELLTIMELIEQTDLITSSNSIKLLTYHSVKGLEFPVVFLPFLNDDIIPAFSNDISDEKRLLYVGITRAKKELILSYSGNNPSRFIRELRNLKFIKFN